MPSASEISEVLGNNIDFWSNCTATESETLGTEPQSLCLNKFLRSALCTLKFEN